MMWQLRSSKCWYPRKHFAKRVEINIIINISSAAHYVARKNTIIAKEAILQIHQLNNFWPVAVYHIQHFEY